MKYKIDRELVRRKIVKEKLTQAEAAARIGISSSTLSEIMKTGQCAGMSLGKLAKFVDVPAWLLVI